MSYVTSALNTITSFLTSLDTTGWMVVSAIMLTVGVTCMRGYGSRADY